ncbi:formate--tetrahydrofolate ligase [Crenobacter intestini]|uniref:Formate--tetrahydrofolate ligase n=1 Tax=Crenobacter intestini TaxID=2563443 RepID=A0A4T0V7G6_9NEIS|nr:formate--tetrahydrofolate ligase [Crenobacter intestini]TIC87245.1 formate--tetrahydrofolate ligase [Crenobacter intestini]
MLSDTEIARLARPRPIEALAGSLGLSPDEFEPYGRDKAKVGLSLARQPHGRLVLVTATSGTPAGSGKTTVSVALADGLARLGQRAALALREPSLGPCFGMKGGATGGGYAQVVPSTSINLHFTGDFHAITSANNLLAALVDNARHHGAVSLKQVLWRRVLDVNDRALRQMVSGLGGPANGVPAETGFDITAASEIMAALCLADGEADLRARLDRLLLGVRADGRPYTCAELGATGALMALLVDAQKPNLVQTLEGTPAFVHGGPFANIAHGCNSLAATRAALACADWAVTEAGFGSDLGAEKFFNIKCRQAKLAPAACVLVTSLKALRWHGGVELSDAGHGNADALSQGLANLGRHLDNLFAFGQRVVVALNRFAGDEDDEIALVRGYAQEKGARFAVCEGYAKGGEGAVELAQAVMDAASSAPAAPAYSYPLDAPLEEKLGALCRRVYRGAGVELSARARADLAQLKAFGCEQLPVCVAKTPFSFSHDAKLRGAPEGFVLPIERLYANAGAGFVVAMAGSVLRMPGLPRQPQAFAIDVSGGEVSGLP